MNTVKHRIRLDLEYGSACGCFADGGPVFVRRGDDLSHELVVSLKSGHEPYIISDDTRVYLYALSKEGDRYLENCSVEGSEIRILLKGSMLERSENILELRLVGANGEILSSPAVRVAVLNSDMYERAGTELSAVEDYSALLRALRRAEDVAIAALDIEDDDLYVTYGDGSYQKVGRVKGDQGIQGETGPAGKAGFIASAEQPDAVDVLWLDTDDADEEDEGYTKAEVDAMFGEYITEVDALIGGEE